MFDTSFVLSVFSMCLSHLLYYLFFYYLFDTLYYLLFLCGWQSFVISGFFYKVDTTCILCRFYVIHKSFVHTLFLWGWHISCSICCSMRLMHLLYYVVLCVWHVFVLSVVFMWLTMICYIWVFFYKVDTSCLSCCFYVIHTSFVLYCIFMRLTHLLYYVVLCVWHFFCRIWCLHVFDTVGT